MERFPEIEPFAQGMLDLGDDQRISWEASGNPGGKPALTLHGGPGSGSSPGRRRLFDPQAYLVVQFDQRVWAEYTARRRPGDRPAVPGAGQRDGPGLGDLGGPADTAWQLARAWPTAELPLVATGHAGGEEMTARALAATNRFARLER